MTRQGTAIADALTLAQTVYDPRVVQQGVLILMSDGENHEGDPIEAARVARENGLTVHVVGYGTPDGDVIPMFNADGTVTYKTDRASQIVITRLNESVLQAIAEAGGGTYRRAESTGIDAVELANVIAQVQAETVQAQQLTRGVERFGVFVLIAVVLLSIEMLMGERRPENEAQA
jgi:Ca-activated chloride channel family protein